MPWAPELFSVPVLQRLREKWERELVDVPFFDGLLAGEFDALVESFAGEPEVHHPVRGRIKGVPAFESFVNETKAWLSQRNISVEDVDHVVADPHRFGEVVLHLEGETGRVDLPVAIIIEKQSDRRIDELRMFAHARWSTTSYAGARRSYSRRQGSRSTLGVKAASSLRPASMTTSPRRSSVVCSRRDPEYEW